MAIKTHSTAPQLSAALLPSPYPGTGRRGRSFEVLDLFCVGVALGQVDGAGIAGGLLSRGIDAAVVFIDFALAIFVGNESALELEAVGSAEGVSGCVPGSFGGNEEAGEFVYSGQIVLIRLLCAVLQEASGLPKAYTRKSRSWMCRS